mgnify:CR=1 FL=1
MNIKLPELGEGIDNVEVTDILVKKGTSVKENDVLIVVESDKASMEIPTESPGTIIDILINKGDSLKPGDTIIKMDIEGESDQVLTADKDEAEPEQDLKEEIKKEKVENNASISSIEENLDKIEPTIENVLEKPNKILSESYGVIATPSVRKLARELGCDLNNIIGSEKNNRITKEDVLNHVKSSLQNNQIVKSEKAPSQKEEKSSKINEKDFLKFGSIQKVSFNKIRSITAKRMLESWTSIPHVTHFDEVKINHILELKKQIDILEKNKKVSILTFIAYALIKTLSKMNDFNSSPDIENDVLIIKNYINLGIAVDTPKGLLVPTIKNAHAKSLKQINDSIIDLSSRARNGSLKPEDMSGGTFTISSLGSLGGKFFTPIINHPEVAIMGVSRAFTSIDIDHYNVPIKNKILPFSLSYDHRVIDGANAARFCNLFKDILTNLNSLD